MTELPLREIEDGLAEELTLLGAGAALTLTETESVAPPPGPVQANV